MTKKGACGNNGKLRREGDKATDQPREPVAQGDGVYVDGSLFLFSPLRTLIYVC